MFQTSSGCSFPNPWLIPGPEQKLKKRIFGKKQSLVTNFSSGFIAGGYRDTSLSSLKREKMKLKRDEKRATERIQHYTTMRQQKDDDEQRLRAERKQRRARRRVERKAAVEIQRIARGYLQRKHNREQELLRMLQHNGAVKFQSLVRMYISLLFVRRRRRAWTRAALSIQTKVRAWLSIVHAKQELARRRSERNRDRQAAEKNYVDHHATVIQRHVRGRQSRHRVQQLRRDIAQAEKDAKDALSAKRNKAMKKAEKAARQNAYRQKHRKVPRYMQQKN